MRVPNDLHKVIATSGESPKQVFKSVKSVGFQICLIRLSVDCDLQGKVRCWSNKEALSCIICKQL